MTSPLPCADISFCDEAEERRIAEEFLQHKGVHLEDDAEWGYSLEVSLSIPERLANYFSAYPPIAEKRIVSPDEYSVFTKNLVKTHELRIPRSSVSWVVPGNYL